MDEITTCQVIENNELGGIAPLDPATAAGPPPSNPGPWIVPGLLCHGLSILAGPPKSAKSWLALDFAVAVATGGLALRSIACAAGNVLYFDMENGEERTSSRLDMICGGARPDLSRLERYCEVPVYDHSITEALDAWRADVPQPRLVVIDAPREIGPVAGGSWTRRNLREEELANIQRWAVRHRLAVLVVSRSGKDGMFEAADAALLFEQKAGMGTLRVAGRDMVKRKMTLAFDRGAWVVCDPGDASSGALRSEVMAVLRSSAWAMSPRQVARELGVSVGNIRKTMSRMARDGQIARWSRGEYLLQTVDYESGGWMSPDVLPDEMKNQWFQRDGDDPAWREREV